MLWLQYGVYGVYVLMNDEFGELEGVRSELNVKEFRYGRRGI